MIHRTDMSSTNGLQSSWTNPLQTCSCVNNKSIFIPLVIRIFRLYLCAIMKDISLIIIISKPYYIFSIDWIIMLSVIYIKINHHWLHYFPQLPYTSQLGLINHPIKLLHTCHSLVICHCFSSGQYHLSPCNSSRLLAALAPSQKFQSILHSDLGQTS